MASTTEFMCVASMGLCRNGRSFGATRTADAACQLDEGLLAVIDVENVAVVGNLEPCCSPLLSHVIQHEGIVENNLHGGVHLLDLDRDRHRRRRGGEIVV